MRISDATRHLLRTSHAAIHGGRHAPPDLQVPVLGQVSSFQNSHFESAMQESVLRLFCLQHLHGARRSLSLVRSSAKPAKLPCQQAALGGCRLAAVCRQIRNGPESCRQADRPLFHLHESKPQAAARAVTMDFQSLPYTQLRSHIMTNP